MDTRTYFTVSSVIGILYALGFLLIPRNMVLMFGGPQRRTLFSTFSSAGRRFWRGA
jgi:hypothetical protein